MADLKTTKLLLTDGANVKHDTELLVTAIKKGCTEIVGALLQHDADVNASDEYGIKPLHYTAMFSDNPFSALHSEVDPSVRGEIAKLLLSYGAHVDAQTRKGVTTLFAASEKGLVEVIEVLLERRANVNAKMKDGATALHIASQRGHQQVVKLLLDHGAAVGSKMKNDLTPLHVGAQCDHQAVVKTMLKFGANVDARDELGRTALHIASQKGHSKVVETLLEYGCDINATTKRNNSALPLAMASFYTERRKYYGGKRAARAASIFDDSCDDDDDHSRDPVVMSCAETAQVLVRHIFKMKTANLYVSKSNLQAIRCYEPYDVDDDDYSNFQYKCEREIARMMSEKIDGTNVSLYDFLAKGTSSLEIYLRDENILQVLKGDEYKTKFPMYASMIKSQFRKGMARKGLLIQGSNNFHLLLSSLPAFPRECTAKIFSYLSNNDLKILMEACESLRIEMERKQLLGHGSIMFRHLTHCPHLPRDCTEEIFGYLSNEDLKILMEAFEPLRISMERRELLDRARKLFQHLTHLPELPRDCTAQIFSYLSNEDLKMLMKVCEPLSSINPDA